MLQDNRKMYKLLENVSDKSFLFNTQKNIEAYQRPLDPVVQRMIDDEKQRQEKRDQLKKQQANAEEEELSKIIAPQKSKKATRTHEQFMEDQINHEQKRFEKLRDVLVHDQEEELSFFKPQVSKGSRKIFESKRKTEEEDLSKSVHERLYTQKQGQMSTQMKSMLEEEAQFKPKINKRS